MGRTYGWIAPTLCFNVGYAASLTNRGEFGLVLLFSGWVTCGHRIPPLGLCGCVYRMEEVIQPTPIEKTRNQVHTALPYLCLCHECPRLALNSKATTHARLVPGVPFLLCCECVQRRFPTPPILLPGLCQRLQKAKWEKNQTKHASSAGPVLVPVASDLHLRNPFLSFR